MSEVKSQKTKEVDKNIELIKIQVYSESVHSKIETMQTFILGTWAGFFVLFYALYYQGIFQIIVFIITISILTFFILILLWYIRKDYDKGLKNISLMLEEIEKGNKIPSLNDLLEKRK